MTIKWNIFRKIGKAVCLILTIVLAAVHIFAAYSGTVDPAKSSLCALAALAFPYILLVTATVMMIWLAILKWRIALIPLAALLISIPTIGMVSPLNVAKVSTTPQEEATKFKVLTFNVMDFSPYDSTREEGATLKYLLKQDADVVLLQEASLNADYNQLKAHQKFMDELNKKYPYRSHGYHDQAILSKHPYQTIEDERLSEGFGSPDNPMEMYHFYARAFDVLLPGHTVRIVNVHLKSIGLSHEDRKLYEDLTKLNEEEVKRNLRNVKNSLLVKLKNAFVDRAEQARALRKVLNNSITNVIVCGDFNDTPGSYAYRTIMGNDMNDAFRECGFGPVYTFRDKRMFFKIDHILYRGDMRAVDYSCDHEGNSDHYPQAATFVWKH